MPNSPKSNPGAPLVPSATPDVPGDDLSEAYDEMLAISEALDRLSAIDPRQVRIVELRYFGGLTEEEKAEVLGISTRTVKRDWTVARSWLHAELTKR